jgi:MFS family permease
MRRNAPPLTSVASLPDRRVVIAALGVTQILAWGSSYYLPAVLAAPIARDTGWPPTWVVGGLSLGLLVAALIAPRVGRAIEHHGGRPVLALSAVAIGIGQAGLSMAPNLIIYIVSWLMIGVGMGTGLYDAAFGALGRIYGRDARAAITALTLFGGLASTVCWPLSAFLLAEIGWRGACAVYAAIQLGLALPLYLFVIPGAESTHATSSDDRNREARPTPEKPSPSLLAALATTLTLAATLSSLMSVHLLTILQTSGMALAAAVGLGALVGPSQVAARAIEMAIARHHHPIWTKMASVGFVAIGLSALSAGFPIPAVALASYGAGIGLESIARGTLPLALFGAPGYASLMGRLAMPSLLAQAAAPSIGAVLLQRLGAHGTLGIVASLATLNVALTGGLAWMVSSRRRSRLPSSSDR